MSDAALTRLNPGASTGQHGNLRAPFRPGVSGNPRGRPKGEKGLAAYVRRKTRNGRELADLMLAIMRGTEPAPLHERMAAVSWLANRAFGPAGETPEGARVAVFTLIIGGRDDDGDP